MSASLVACADRSVGGSDSTDAGIPDSGAGERDAAAPPSSRIAYLRYEGLERRLFTSDLEGGDEIAVSGRAHDPTDFAWSPDGTRVAYVAQTDERILIASADGTGEPTVLVPPGVHSGIRSLAWSVDGTIAFTAVGDVYDIYVVDETGGTPAKLLMETTADGFPSWSPDGSRLAFVRETGPDAVYVVDAAGGTPALVTDILEPRLAKTTWWTTGGDERIAFSDPAGTDPESPHQVFTVRPDGTEREQLTTLEGGATTPSFSRDGSRLLVVSVEAAEGHGVYEIVLATGASRLLVPEGMEAAFQP